MGPAVAAAVLLLVGVVNSITTLSDMDVYKICSNENVKMHGTYWASFDKGRLMRYYETPQTYQEAEAQCTSVDSDLVSIHNLHEMNHAMCMSLYFSSAILQPFWIGAQNSDDGFEYEDGTNFKFTNWLPNQQDNNYQDNNNNQDDNNQDNTNQDDNNQDGSYQGQDGCIEANAQEWGKWNNVSCSAQSAVLCVKKKRSFLDDICVDIFHSCDSDS